MSTLRRTTATAFFACLLISPLRAQQGRDDTARSQHKASAEAPSPAARIDINHASVDELRKIPGMTPTWAARIVRFRPYRTKADLLEHGILPSDVYDRIKDYIIAHRDPQ